MAINGIPISIHALREEGDFLTPAPMPRRPNFYPRPPRGGRHYLTNMSMAYFQFLSTPSARRATSKSRPSIKPETFLSTPSARRATEVEDQSVLILVFLSTPSARRATCQSVRC